MINRGQHVGSGSREPEIVAPSVREIRDRLETNFPKTDPRITPIGPTVTKSIGDDGFVVHHPSGKYEVKIKKYEG